MATHVTDATFDATILKASSPVLLDFWAPWCGPCRSMSPIIDELAAEYPNIIFAKMNVDENPIMPGRFGIRAIPTIILFKNGEVLEQVTGALTKTNLVDMLTEKGLV